MVESPREVYLEACAAIADRFADRGFRFARSGPHLTRKAGDFTFRIAFQSSHHNVAGVSVKLWIHANVRSKRLEQWRKTYPELHATDFVAGGQIGNLEQEPTWHGWDLAKERKRPSVIVDACSKIETVALPYFGRFENLETFIDDLQHTDIPSMSIDRVVEFLMCFADRSAAKAAAANFLRRHPQFAANYERDFERYAEQGLKHKRPSGYASHLAFAAHVFGFGSLKDV